MARREMRRTLPIQIRTNPRLHGLLVATAALSLIVVAGCRSRQRPRAGREAADGLDQAAVTYRSGGWPWVARDLQSTCGPPNGAVQFRRAESAFPFDEFDRASNQLETLAAQGRFAELSRRIAAYDPFIDLAVAVTGANSLWFARNWDIAMSRPFPEYGHITAFVRAICLRAEARASNIDIEGAIRDLHAAWRLSGLASCDPTVVALLTGMKDEIITLRAAVVCAARFARTSDLSRLAEILDENRTENLEPALKTEAYSELAIARNFVALGGIRGIQRVASGEFGISRTNTTPGWFRQDGLPEDATARANTDDVLRVWSAVTPLLSRRDLPIWDLSEAVAGTLAGAERQAGRGGELVRLICDPALYRTVAAVAKYREADLRVASALVRALIVRSRSGAFPKDAVSIPGARLDPYTNQPLKVKVRAGAYRVYSVGPDLRDDGGLGRHEPGASDSRFDIVAAYPPAN